MKESTGHQYIAPLFDIIAEEFGSYPEGLFQGAISVDKLIKQGGFWYGMCIVFAKYYTSLPTFKKKSIDNFINTNQYLVNETLEEVTVEEFDEIFDEFRALLNEIKK